MKSNIYYYIDILSAARIMKPFIKRRYELIFSINQNSYRALIFLFIVLFLFPVKTVAGDNLAFPGAMGWGGESRGAWSHPDVISGQTTPEIYRVTNLNRLGPGSFRYGVWDDPSLLDGYGNRTNGRIIVFEVGGVIDMRGSTIGVRSYITIAGQTAPPPGITIINSSALRIQDQNDVIAQHLMIRPGQGSATKGSGWEPGGIVVRDSYNIVVDHNSVTWHIDQGITVRGTDYWLTDNEEGKLATSHNVTVSNNLIGEGLDDSSHEKGPHSKGMLLASRPWNILIVRNLFSHNAERNPHWATDGGQTIILNNVIYNWGTLGGHPGMDTKPEIMHEHSMIGNIYQAGADSDLEGGPLRFGGGGNPPPAHFYLEDNIGLDINGNLIPFTVAPAWFNWDLLIELNEPPYWYPGLENHILNANQIESYLAQHVGARPWDRDPIDQRIIQDMIDKTGSIIDHENDREGIPDYEPTYSVFNPDEWDLRYMIPHTGYWNAPELHTPENNAVIIGQSTTFDWETINIFTHYTIQIAKNDDFASLIVDATDITGTNYTASNLSIGTTYSWRVRGHNATGPSKWSEVRRFSTEDANEPLVPSKPSLNSPQNGYTGTSSTILLEWSAANNAEWYSVQVSTQSNFSNIAVQNNNLTQTFYELTDLQATSTYYWRVRAHNSNGDSEWSEVRHFNLVLENETESQNIYLDAGWNHISSYVMHDNPSITDVFSGIENNLVVVKNDRYGVYWPEFGVNEIEEWNPTQGYQVYVVQNDVLFFSGNLLSPESTPIQLSRGWNPIAYLRTSAMPIEEALAGIHDQLELVSNNDGDVYWPALNVTDLDMMIPGQGYKVSVTQDVTLTYPANSEKSPARMSGDGQIVTSTNSNYYKARFYVLPFNKTGDFAILLLKSPNLGDGDEVGVWSPADELVGSGVARSGQVLITVWGRNPVWNGDDGVHGAANGEMLYVTQWSTKNGQEYPLPISSIRDRRGMQQADPVLRYRSDAVWIVEADALIGIPNRYTLEQNYPNPFNPSTTIRYGIPETVNVRLEVYNAIGQRIAVLVDEEKHAGFHQVLFDASNLASGVYFLRLHAGYYISMKRTVLMR
jgi:hypothetical protein